MVVGVIVFSDFIGSLSLDDSNQDSKEVRKYKTRIEYLRNKYDLAAKSVLQLEKIITKSINCCLKEEIAILNDLPLLYKNAIMFEIRLDYEKKILLFENLSQEMFE